LRDSFGFSGALNGGACQGPGREILMHRRPFAVNMHAVRGYKSAGRKDAVALGILELGLNAE
jgi:hypothetical protein